MTNLNVLGPIWISRFNLYLPQFSSKPSTENLNNFLPGIVKCQWKTIAGTARSPEDYTETTGAVQFASGSRSAIVNITIVDDNDPELSKTFKVELFNPEGGGKLNQCLLVAEF